MNSQILEKYEVNMWLNKLKHPLLFQGNKKRKDYFEGWYFKQVSKDEKSVISFIPGISLFNNEQHSFVQYIFARLDQNHKQMINTGYIKYDINAFDSKDRPFALQIENNIFTESMISINMEDAQIKIEGTLKLDAFTPIKKSIGMPNIMGYFAYIPKMECYHGVVSMNHTVNGILRINNEEIDFENGKGYIEKDWGTSFPEKYIWIQCNNFRNHKTSIFCSIANIPFMRKSFLGFICNILVEGKEYRFATYNNSNMHIESIINGKIILLLENRKATLRLEANIRETAELIAPKLGRMEKIIKEGLSGGAKFSLYDKQNQLNFEDDGSMAGIEIVGF